MKNDLGLTLSIGVTLVLCGAAHASTYSDAVLAHNPLSYWQLDEAGGTTAVNAATGGDTYDGTYSGAVGHLLGGIPGAGGASAYVAAFDGASFMTASDANLPSGSAARSVVVWVNTGDTRGQYNTIAAYGSGGNFYQVFGLNRDFQYGDMTATNWGSGVNSSQWVMDGQWHMLAVTIDPNQVDGSGNPLWSIYVDGGSAQTGNLITNTVLSQVNIGGGGSYNNWYGLISQVAYFGTTLSSTQISELYTAGITPVPEPASLALVVLGGLALFRKSSGRN